MELVALVRPVEDDAEANDETKEETEDSRQGRRDNDGEADDDQDDTDAEEDQLHEGRSFHVEKRHRKHLCENKPVLSDVLPMVTARSNRKCVWSR